MNFSLLQRHLPVNTFPYKPYGKGGRGVIVNNWKLSVWCLPLNITHVFLHYFLIFTHADDIISNFTNRKHGTSVFLFPNCSKPRFFWWTSVFKVGLTRARMYRYVLFCVALIENLFDGRLCFCISIIVPPYLCKTI